MTTPLVLWGLRGHSASFPRRCQGGGCSGARLHAPLTLLPKGLEEAADIIFFVFLVGGVIGVLRKTGAIDALISLAIRHLTTTALLIGFARTIEVVLSEARVIDTIVHNVATLLESTSSSVAAIGTLGVQSACNFLIPSGSGQACVTMPLMAPLADITGVGREAAIFAYQFGDGLRNMVVPTNALLMGMLGLGRVPYQRWLRFILPLMVLRYGIAIGTLILVVRLYPDS